MMLRPLLLLPLLLPLAACAPVPEVTASPREEAFELCLAEVETKVKEVTAQRQLAKEQPELFDRDRDDFYDNFSWTFLISDEFEKVTILRSFCRQRPSTNKSYGSNIGYIEYLVQPLDGFGDAEVKQVYASYGYTWKIND